MNGHRWFNIVALGSYHDQHTTLTPPFEEAWSLIICQYTDRYLYEVNCLLFGNDAKGPKLRHSLAAGVLPKLQLASSQPYFQTQLVSYHTV